MGVYGRFSPCNLEDLGMSTSSRLTPKEIKAWCEKTLNKYIKERLHVAYGNDDVYELMYKAYKRGYQDALSG